MGLFDSIGEFFGLSEPDIDVTTPGQQLSEEQVEFRESLRGTIEQLFDERPELQTALERVPDNIRSVLLRQLFQGADDELIQGLRTEAVEQLSGEQERQEEQLEAQLTQRGLNRSGIAIESLADVANEVVRQRRQVERDLQRLQSERQLSALQQALELSTSADPVQLREQQLQQDALQQGLSLADLDRLFAQNAAAAINQNAARRFTAQQQGLGRLFAGTAELAANPNALSNIATNIGFG